MVKIKECDMRPSFPPCGLYRSLYEIIHPTISKMNISDYRIILKDDLLPIRVFYPPKIGAKNYFILYFPSLKKTKSGMQKKEYFDVCERIAYTTGSIVLTPSYQEDKEYFEFIEDCYNIVHYLYEEFQKLHVSKEKIVLMGDSFGATFIIILTYLLQRRSSIQIEKEILLYPVFDFINHKRTSSYDLLTEKYVKDFFKTCIKNEKANPLVNPLLINNYKKFPKTLLITGEFNPIKQKQQEYYKRLAKEEIFCKYLEIKDESHGFLFSNNIEVVETLTKEITNFLK